MNSITLDNIKTFREKYNMALMVCSKSDNPKHDKKPESYWTGKYKSNGKKEYKWKVNPTEDELIQKQRSILEQYSHFIDLKEPQKKIVEAEIRGDRKAAKYKEGFDLAVKQLRENGISNHEAERLRKIAEEPVEDGSALVEYNKRREKERRNGKKR